MADKIFSTDFTERTAGTAQDGDKILVQGTDAATTQYIQAGTIAKELTGLERVAVGSIPVKNADGKFSNAGIIPSDITITTEGVNYDIVVYDSERSIMPSGLQVHRIASWVSSHIKGLFTANVNINNNTLVGRIGFDNGTRGLSLGLYNNGSAQRVAMHASSSNAVSSTPQWLATEDYVNLSVGSLGIDSAQLDTDVLPADSVRVGNTITIPAQSSAVRINGAVLTSFLSKNVLIRTDGSYDFDAVGVWLVSATGETELDEITLTFVGYPRFADGDPNNFRKSYIRYNSNDYNGSVGYKYRLI